MSDIISSRWCTMCIQPEYAPSYADPRLEASVAEKMAVGVPMAQAIAELVELQSAKPREALRRSELCSSCGEPLTKRPRRSGGRRASTAIAWARLKPGTQDFLNPNGKGSGS